MGWGQSLLHLPHPAHQPPGKHLLQWASKALTWFLLQTCPTHKSILMIKRHLYPVSHLLTLFVDRMNNQLLSLMLKASQELAPRASPSTPSPALPSS